MIADPRDAALQVDCWCGAAAGRPCLGRPSLRRAMTRERRSLHRWRYARALQPAWNLPGRSITLVGVAQPLSASHGASVGR
jgi:hypothetical protein